MIFTPKIKYQIFLYNYFLQYITHNLYNEYYQYNNTDLCLCLCLCIQEKETLLDEKNKFIQEIKENEKKFKYKDYDDYFYKHISYYKFVQKIKSELKNKYDSRIENIYKNIYNPKVILQLLENNMEIDDIFNSLNNETQNIMYNVF
jgi:hypothetical protein